MKNIYRSTVCVLLTLIVVISALRYVTDFWLLALVYSFQPHIGVACAIVALVSYPITRSRYMLVLAAAGLGLTAHALVMLQEFAEPSNSYPGEKVYRIMSFNVLTDNLGGTQDITRAIETSQADVVFIMEAAPLKPALVQLAETYPYRVGCGAQTTTCDLLILSRHPLRSSSVSSLSDLRRDRFAQIAVELDGREVRFAAAHLTKPYFDDYHEIELAQLAEYARNVAQPLIIAGDFNSSSIAPDMQRFLRDVGLHTARGGEPATWPVEAGRWGIAIDHIFARAPITLVSTKPLPDSLGSNHFGLIAEFTIKER